MKCPKCGFNSFEYYDICKKCAGDLTSHKQLYAITSIVLPMDAQEELAAEIKSAEASAVRNKDSIEIHDDIFSFDLPDEPQSLPSQSIDDPFGFDVLPPDENRIVSTNSDDTFFADLLETTSIGSQSPFADEKMTIAPASADPVESVFSSGSGEYDLENFSWDDASSKTAVSEGASVTDDFDALFGEAKDKSSK
jgi:predicted  nucleic acid-binding Zn-ribbon protein